LTRVVTIWHMMFMIRSFALSASEPAPRAPAPSFHCEPGLSRALVVPNMSTRKECIKGARAAKESMLAWPCPELGGESNPFGRQSRVTDFPDPPVCPPRVEGACVSYRPRPLSSPQIPCPLSVQP